MPRAYEQVIPPEYKIQATQVTQYGEPVVQEITPSAYGTMGRSCMDPNDPHIRNEAQVWKKGQSPLVTAQKATDIEVARLTHLTRTGQLRTPEVTEKEGGSLVTYKDMSSDDQVSNIRNLKVTGDPQTVGRALKAAGQTSFESNTGLDIARGKASAHRATRNMPTEHRKAFQEALAIKGASALESLAPTQLAGMLVENLGTTSSGVAQPRRSFSPGELDRGRRMGTGPMRPMGMGPRRLRQHTAAQVFSGMDGVGYFGAISPAAQLAIAKKMQAQKQTGISPKLPAVTKPPAQVPKQPTKQSVPVAPKQVASPTKSTASVKQAPAAVVKAAVASVAKKAATTSKAADASRPKAFDQLVQQKSAQQNAAVASKAAQGTAVFHPAASNFEDSTGTKSKIASQQKAAVVAAATTAKAKSTTPKAATPKVTAKATSTPAIKKLTGGSISKKLTSAQKEDVKQTTVAKVSSIVAKAKPSSETSQSGKVAARQATNTLKSLNNAHKKTVTVQEKLQKDAVKASDKFKNALKRKDAKAAQKAKEEIVAIQGGMAQVKAQQDQIEAQQDQVEQQMQLVANAGDLSQSDAQAFAQQVHAAEEQKQTAANIDMNLQVQLPSQQTIPYTPAPVPGVASEDSMSYVSSDGTPMVSDSGAGTDGGYMAAPSGMSTGAKIGIGIGLAALAGTGIFFLVRK